MPPTGQPHNNDKTDWQSISIFKVLNRNGDHAYVSIYLLQKNTTQRHEMYKNTDIFINFLTTD